MSNLLLQLNQSMKMALFEHLQDNQFKALSPIDDWLKVFLPRTTQKQPIYNLEEHFLFLSCFLPEACEHWESKTSKILKSTYWIEEYEGKETAFEAQAIWIDEKPILILQNVDEHYLKQVDYLQKARDSLLVKEVLENEVMRRTALIKQREEEIAIKLVSVTSYRDEETGAHIRRIGLYAAAMAEALNWERQAIEDIRIAAPMHDIGKVGIPDSILLKAGKLTDSEFSIMKRHTKIGEEMLRGSQIPVMDMAAEIALNHHERWDGTGYPNGLKGTQIAETARITAIIDIYDALVHERVYKKAFREEDALRLLQESAGSHIDPYLYKVFLSILPTIREIKEANQDIDATNELFAY